MSERWLPYGRQTIEDDDVAAVARVLRSDFLTTGPEVEAFEKELAAACGVKHAVAVSNGTAALHAAYAAAGVGPDDEVVTSPLTFSATANMALALGARPVFADVLEGTLCLDPEAVERALTPRHQGHRARGLCRQHGRHGPLLGPRRTTRAPLGGGCVALGGWVLPRPAGGIAGPPHDPLLSPGQDHHHG